MCKAGWLLAAVLCIALAGQADAQIFVYKDAYGRTYFSDTPQHDGFAKYRPKSDYELRNPGREPRVSARVTRAYDPAIKRASKDHGVSAALVKAVIAAESGFDPFAVSRKGAQGLMQLMPKTARDLGVDDALDPWQNIDGGTRYLGKMIDRFPGRLSLAVAAYNAGPEAVTRHQGVPPYQETRTYVKRVLRYYKKYNADFRR
ncbi:MAG: transglycosylase SLT domain-containing protein [Myxococcota bacterium]